MLLGVSPFTSYLGVRCTFSVVGLYTEGCCLQAARGTPAYMAPELFQQGAAQSTASDLWALGCIFYECFTGRPPFENPSFHELVSSILNADPSPLHSDDTHFIDLVSRLLDKNPATRMSWVEMLTHPFWRFSLSPLQVQLVPLTQLTHLCTLRAKHRDISCKRQC